MGKGAYVGVEGVARKIKKGYVGVDGIARKVKKAYVGVGGVARPCWSGGELTYYGTVAELSEKESYLATATVGDYALFGGGGYSRGKTTVYAYDSALTRSTPTVLSKGRTHFAATSVGNYALFGGGNSGSSAVTSSDHYANVDAYDSALTRSTPTSIGTRRSHLAAANVGNYALFGGGRCVTSISKPGTYYANVDAYDSALTRSTPTSLSTTRAHLAATSVGNYALFGGGSIMESGWVTTVRSTVDAYDRTLTRLTAADLIVGRANLSAATVGDYALFGGGTYFDAVDAYDSTLTRSTPTALSLARGNFAAATIGDYALFVGGMGDGSNSYFDTVDAYDAALTRSTPTSISVARAYLSAAAVGDYALFGGGNDSSYYYSNVDAYTAS